MNIPIEGMTLRPEGECFMSGAWLGLVIYVASDPEAVRAFHTETGYDLKNLLRRTPIETMIDDSTGNAREVIAAFADWVTFHWWGVEGCSEPEELDATP